MISCKLKGGLGNQLFQISAAHALALKNNDISGFNLNGCYTPLQGNPSTKYKNNILSKINDISEINSSNVYVEPTFSHNEIPYSNNLVLDGYFQSEKYFKEHKNEIIDLFHFSYDDRKTVRDFLIWWGVTDKPITSVHIRRGDYLSNPDFHPVCELEYYTKAMKEIGDSYFIFISDDMDWVEKNFRGKNFVHSTFNDEILDLTLMTECDHNIISNSSFSWWGAYLNRNPNKKVIAPKKWFGPKGPQDTQDIIPSDWSIINL